MSEPTRDLALGVEQPPPLRSLTAAEARTRLEAEAQAGTGAGEGRKAKTLPLSAVEAVESLFQPRGIAEHQVTGMVKDLKAGGDLPPLLVYWTGARAVLLDGHHRMEAHRRAKRTGEIPIEWFKGNLDAAIAEAGARNCQDKLPMTKAECMNFAWRLVKLGTLSKAQIKRATKAGDGQVAIMRRVLRTLESDDPESIESYPTWLKAKAAAEGKKGWTGMTEAEVKDHMEEQAREWTRRIGNVVGTKLAGNPEMAAMALAGLLGKKLPDVVGFLIKDHLRREDLEKELVEDDFSSDF